MEGIQYKEKDFEKVFVWIGDTGASSHMSHVWEGFTRVSEGQAKACFARDGDEAQARVSGDWKGRYHYTRKGNKYERGTMLNLEDVLWIPDLRNNLFSITKEITRGAKLVNKETTLVLKYPDGEERGLV